MKSFSICFFLILLTGINFYVYPQDPYEIIKNHKKVVKNEKRNEYKLILISSSGCGHCAIALEKLKSFDDRIQIIVIDYGDEAKREKLKIKYDYNFLNGNEIEKLGFQDFFPKLFLYDATDKLIWKKKGWFNSNIGKINSRIKIH